MRKIYLFLFFIVSFMFNTTTVAAQSIDEQVGFSVQAVLPESQRDTGVTYFDLLVEPEENYTLQVNIYNHEEREIEVRVTPTTAATNRNGLIVYDEQEDYDASLQYVISDLIKTKHATVTVPANGKTAVYFHLTIPEEPFTGYLLGGLHFEKVINGEGDSAEGVQIKNNYAYLIGLQVTEDEKHPEPNLEFIAVEPALVNYRTAVVAKIQNNRPAILSKTTISAEIFEEGEEEPLRTSQMENITFAPNSTMDYAIDWENNYLEPGNYHLMLSAVSGENEWKWEETFAISEEQGKISNDAVELETFTWLTPGLFIAVILILLIVILLLLYRLKRNNK